MARVLALFAQFKISHKLWAGFGTLVLLLLLVSLTALKSLSDAKENMTKIVDEVQPTLLASMGVADALDRTNAALGFYLLSKTESDKNEYLANLKFLDESVVRLAQMPNVQNQSEILARVQQVANGIEKFKGYKDRMLELAVDINKNQPGRAFSVENMAPIASNIQQNLTQMLDAEDEEDANEERKTLLLEIADLRQLWMNILNENRAFMAFRGQPNIENTKLFRLGFIEKVAQLASQEDMLNFEQAEAIEAIQSGMNHYFSLQDKMFTIHSGEKWRTDAYLISHEIGPLLHDIKQNIDQIIEHQQNGAEQASDSLLNQVDATTSIIGALLVLGLIVGVGGAVLITMLISRPLKATVDAMTDIAEGEGDLTRRLEVVGKDEIAQLSLAFNKFVDKIQTTIKQVANSTSQLAAASEQMSVVSNEASSGVQRQRAETEQVATAMNEMTATVQEVARHAESAAESAGEADAQAQNGRQVVNNTISAIDVLARDVEKAADVIQSLEKDSDEIGTVLEVIRGIAEQTNLLALNAAIEAARAGEQGRGFAVVADEVRSLASRTQSSTEEIQQMIERLQKGSRDAVTVMETGRNQAQISVEQATQAGSALESITSAVDAISAMNNQIAEAARQQGEVADEINQNIINISQVADETSEGTQQLATASAELAHLSQELQTLVSRFKV